MKKIVVLIAAVLTMGCLVCCVGNTADTAANAAANDSTALRVAVLPTAECMPFYVAAQTGVFDSLGVNVRLMTFDAAMDADTAFQRGHVDAVAADLVKAVLWKSRGDSIRVVMTADLNLYLVTSRPARLKTGESLKEKVVAFTRNSALDYTADGMLALSKLQSEQLNKPQINNINLRLQMLLNGQYDGALLPEPYATLATAQGHNLVLSTQNLKHYNPLFAVVAYDSLMRTRRSDMAKLVEAYDVVASRIERTDSADASYWISCLPMETVWPDSVVVLPQVRPSSKPSVSVVDSVKQWLRRRTLLQNDFKNSDLLP